VAYIRRLPSGSFNAVVRLPNGKRKSITDPLKRVVQQRAGEIEAAMRRGDAVHLRDRKLTVGEWAAKWSAARNVEKTTAAKDASQMRTHVLPRWGDWPLVAIGRLDVQTWVKQMTHAGVGASTVVGSYHRFAALMSDAVLEGLIGASPCREIDLPKIVKPEPRWLTRHEYDRVQLALAAMPRPEVWQAYVALGCFSGLRPGELGGLDVPTLDFDRHIVYVSQVVTRQGLRPYGKTSSATRWVEFPDEVARLLWALVADRSQGPVFTSPTGLRVNEANFRNRVWRPALAAAGVPQTDVYTMRHTAASWWIQAGVPDYEVASALGHSSTRMVATYAHLDPKRRPGIRAAWAATDQNESASSPQLRLR
jgi:integrase